MLRRSHKKSRKGCAECKRRHIKCDETRPRCVNCSTAERICSYPVQADPDSSALSSEGAASTTESDTSSVPPPRTSSIVAELQPLSPPQALDAQPASVNVLHLELFYHFITGHFHFASSYPELGQLALQVTIRHAMKTPYLLYLVLAFAARNLGMTCPAQKSFYFHEAMQLQTQALTLFNACDIDGGDADERLLHRIPAFLFSSLLGYDALVDFLHFRDDSFPVVLSRFVAYIQLHRGVRAVLDGHWDYLRNSELKPLIENGSKRTLGSPVGHECDGLRRNIDSSRLTPAEARACQDAINPLQKALDGRFERDDPDNCAFLVLTWSLLIENGFVELLRAGRPEALAVMAYYAVTLNLCRHVLRMEASPGIFLLQSITQHLGPEWHSWLEWPNRAIRELDSVRLGDG